MKNHQKVFLGIVLILTFGMVLPTTLAFTETEILPSNWSGYVRTIFPEDHRGRIQFSFTANVSLTVQITDAAEVIILWNTFGTNGSCDLDVDKSEMYRARFLKSTGYAVEVEFTVIEGGIPAFAFVYTIFVLFATIGFIYLNRRKLINSQ